MDPYEAQTLRDRYEVAAKRPWKVMMVAGLVALFAHLYFIFVLWPFRISTSMVVNLHVGGIVLATVVAVVAMLSVTRGKWPAVVVLISIGPEAYRLIEVSLRNDELRMRWFDYGLVGGVVTLVVVAVLTLVTRRPEPPAFEPDLPTATAVGR
jgi:hypothetical protein